MRREFAPLSADERARLRNDIQRHGVLVPVLVDAQGVVIDGHERLTIADELGVPCPRVVIAPCTAKEVEVLRTSTNLLRRHLTREQVRQWIGAELRLNPGVSDRMIAARVGVSPSTVGKARVQSGQVGGSRVGRDGKRYKHKTRVHAESLSLAKEASRLLSELGDDAPHGLVRVRALRSAVWNAQRKRQVDGARPVNLPEDFRLIHSDFRKANLPEGCADLVVADPPWSAGPFPRAEFAKEVYRVLSPNGVAISYTGVQVWLDWCDCYRGAGLRYVWSVAALRQTPSVRHSLVRSCWIPLTLWSKTKLRKYNHMFSDVTEGDGPAKGHHTWESPVGELAPLVEALVKPGGLVVDMTLGSGTTAVAVVQAGEGRRFAGCDVDASCVRLARQRVYQALAGRAEGAG